MYHLPEFRTIHADLPSEESQDLGYVGGENFRANVDGTTEIFGTETDGAEEIDGRFDIGERGADDLWISLGEIKEVKSDGVEEQHVSDDLGIVFLLG